MSTKEISNDPAPRNVAAPTPARKEGKEVVPSTKLRDDGVSKPTVSIPRDIINALVEDIKQFKDISFSDPAPGKVAALAWALREGKDVVPSIKRQFGYMMSSKSYAQDLQKEVQKLVDETKRVNNAVEEAINNARNVYSHVTDWQASAAKAFKEAQDLLGDFEGVSETCCYGTLPSPSFRYQFSRKANDKIEDIEKLALEGGKFKELNDIFSTPALGNVAAPNPARRDGKYAVQSATATASVFSASTSNKVRDNGVFESRASIIRDIMDALANDNNSVVGVYGMGGLGKSTLLADVERRIIEKKSFDWVTMADVSENPDIKTIQGEIADALGLTEIKNRESISKRAKLLHRRLEKEEREKKKVLIILDNLWERLDLNKVGIPCGRNNKVIGCKLLLTSRNRYVLQRDMGCDRDFSLGGLEDEEAKRLFEKIVGDKVHDDELKSWVNVVLDKCAGVPFLIVAMAKRFKDAELYEWRNALKNIEDFKDKETNDLINHMLQRSYDKLKEDEKSLLWLCVVYSNPKPSLENLVRYGLGLGLFGEASSMEEARSRLISHIHTLQASSFLLDSEDDGFKIHDLVCEFVASVASRDHPLLVLKDKDKSKDRLNSYRAVCFPYVDMEELPQELDCPELQIFLFFTNNESLKVPDSLFHSMRKLMVLNLTGIRLTSSPSSLFQFLKNLQTLCLDSCSLDDVAFLGELKGLKILSFMNSNIHQLPKEIGQLVELRLLDLNYCPQLEIIEPGVLSQLMKLEELYMKNSFDQWNTVDQTPPTNASLIELNHMKRLCTLHMSIPNLSMLPEDLNVEKLTKYEIQIGNMWHWSSGCKGSMTLKLELDPLGNVLWKGCIQSMLGKTDHLFLSKLDENDQSICSLSHEGFPKLKHLQVENSSSIHYILQRSSLTDFEMLESLLLENLINLEMICNKHVSSKSFSRLKVIRVESCDKMEVLFPLSMMSGLPCLEEIEVVSCKLMHVIIEADECGKFELRNLHVLKLCDLPNIKNFFNAGSAPSSSTSGDQVTTQLAFFNGQQVSFPPLESLTMVGLPNLKYLWSDEFPLGLTNLQSLEVSKCETLSKVINSTSLVKLHKLHTLTIKDCISVQEIFDLDGPSASGNIETISELTNLELKGLPSLRRMWNKHPSRMVQFHNLKQLELSSCDNLRSIFFPFMVKSLATLRVLRVSDCKKMEVIFMEEEGLGMKISETLAFPMLTNLHLEGLESFSSFSSGKYSGEVRSQEHIKLPFTALFNQEVSIPSLESLTMIGLPNLIYLWSDEFLLGLSNLRSLKVSGCKSFSKVINSMLLVKLHKLQTLTIEDCDSVKEIFDLDGPSTSGNDEILSELTTFSLVQLPSLRCIWNMNPCGIARFHDLKKLEVSNCDNLRFMFFSSMDKSLAKLRVLRVWDCEKMEAIIMEEEGLGMETSKTLVFPMLTNLQLGCLESLMCFSRRKCLQEARSQDHVNSRFTVLFNLEVVFPSLETLNITGMHNIEMIWDNHIYFQHLRTLDVSHCHQLTNMFTSTIARKLVALTKLRISNCKTLIEVFSNEGGKEGHAVAFNQLKSLELDRLIGLRCFSSGGYTLMFPLLEDVIVTRCLNMKFFSKGPIEAPKLEKVQESIEAWFWKGNLNMTIQKMYEEMATFAGVEFIRLSKFPELIENWHDKLIPIEPLLKLEALAVDKCPSFVNAIPSISMLALHNMRTLQVRDCESLEEIFDLEGLEGVESTQVLPRLWHLGLVNLPKLRRLWNKNLQGRLSFNSLSHLSLYKCNNLRHAFAPSMIQCFATLKYMEINECGHIEGVITEEEGHGSAMKKITFPNLRWMELEYLPNLTSFLLGKNHTLKCPGLKSLTITHCPEMRSFTGQALMEIDHGTPSLFTSQVAFSCLETLHIIGLDNIEMIWANQVAANSFPNLKSLCIQECNKLKCIWDKELHRQVILHCLRSVSIFRCQSLTSLCPASIARELTQLEELEIDGCGNVELIKKEEGLVLTFVFPKLTFLRLENLTELKCIYTETHALCWLALKTLEVCGCNKVKILASQPNNEMPLHKQHLFLTEKVAFPNLETLHIIGMYNIEMIWDNQVAADSFHNLRLLFVQECNKLKCIWDKELHHQVKCLRSVSIFRCESLITLFPASVANDLIQLEELKINKCGILELIEKEGLEKLSINMEAIEGPSCERKVILPFSACFQHLKTLHVSHCDHLSYLFTPTIVENFVELAELRISNCKMLTKVISNEGGKEGHGVASNQLKNMELDWLKWLRCLSKKEGQGSAVEIIRFPNLCRLELECLPKLTSFLLGNNHMPEWPKLEELTIANCPKMTRMGTFFPRPPSFISRLCRDIQNI